MADWIGVDVLEITRVDGLISREQAAELCGVRPDTISQWVRRDVLPVARREGRNVFFELVALAKAKHLTSRASLRTAARPSVVYYIRFGDRIKIGTTVNIRSRLDDLPHDRLLATEPGGHDLESQRHAQFAEHCITGEWFRPAPELLAHVASLPLLPGRLA